MKSRLPEMLSEEFDKKIRDAAEGHHPAYDEKAWGGMKQLLDKHMPEEKEDRRRFFFFLLFFLLLGGSAWYIIAQSSRRKEKETAIAVQPDPRVSSPSTSVDRQADYKVTISSPVTKEKNIAVDADLSDQPVTTNRENQSAPLAAKPFSKPVLVTTGPIKQVSKTIVPGAKHKGQSATMPPSADDQDKKIRTSVPVVDVPQPLVSADNKTNGDMNKSNKTNSTTSTQKISEAGQPVAISKKEDLKSTDKKAEDIKSNGTEVVKKDKKKSKKNNFFFFSISGGPDASFTGGDKIGKAKLLGGVGLGYTIRNKFTLRTGLYVARKIYTSSPEEYHAPNAFYAYYPNMQKIEADCKVFEIPLSISYNFKRTDKQNFFAGAGLSTYLMKRETYDYYYKYYPTSPTVNKVHTSYNENNHFLSVLSLSAGYQRTISKRISITAEPYFKLPLKGVGFGKVKLNSGGVLFTISVKPFRQAERK
ncbi:MAG TPA: hypothetical protein VMZ03_12725 [Chitinophagaceae bacterium]|nr:hypothetical protein [Chitinophagaceae bacterium]